MKQYGHRFACVGANADHGAAGLVDDEQRDATRTLRKRARREGKQEIERQRRELTG